MGQNPLAGANVPAGVAVAQQSARAFQLHEQEDQRHQEREVRERGQESRDQRNGRGRRPGRRNSIRRGDGHSISSTSDWPGAIRCQFP